MSSRATYMDCLTALLALMDEVERAAGAGDWDLVLTQLEERRELMEQMDQLRENGQLSPAERDRSAQWLRDLALRDQKVSERLQAALTVIREQIEQSAEAEESLKAYRRMLGSGSSGTRPRFVDKQR